MSNYLLVLFPGLLSLLYSAYLFNKIKSVNITHTKLREISGFICDGASAFFTRQYTVMFYVNVVVFALLWTFVSYWTSIGFMIGSFCSALAGYLSMKVAVFSNSRTALSAERGISDGFNTAFRAGSVASFLSIGLAILSVLLCLFISYKFHVFITNILVGLAFGVSITSVFDRLGGGIFTKGADVGADLAGKVEANIPEDDPRNPAVIADNIGDNVGDCKGVISDIFQTYVVTMVGAIYMADIIFSKNTHMLAYTIMLPSLSVIASIFGSFFVKIHRTSGILNAMYKGLAISAALVIILAVALTHYIIGLESSVITYLGYPISSTRILGCVFIGVILSFFIFFITHYYTSSSCPPVIGIARSSKSGAGTNIIQGLAVGMESCFLPGLLIVVSIITSYILADIYGIAIAAVAMISLSGIILACDVYGPIVDNAAGLAEMSSMGDEVRSVTDALDSVGNTTKAVTKGYSISSSILSTLVLFSIYHKEASLLVADIEFYLNDPFVLSGFITGGVIVYLFASLSMLAVNKAAEEVVKEVREQFKDKDILEGLKKPNYAKAVDMLTYSSMKQMALPASLPILFPILSHFILSSLFDMKISLIFLAGLMMGTILFGFFSSYFMTSSGGAWDNAKKLIESNIKEDFGGKGSEAHKAAVIGDTVGDPFKDTSGTAISPMLKTLVILCLLIVLASA